MTAKMGSDCSQINFKGARPTVTCSILPITRDDNDKEHVTFNIIDTEPPEDIYYSASDICHGR